MHGPSSFEYLPSEEVGDYTGMHCGQAHFVTYYRFLGSARHCSVAFAEVRTGEVFQYCN